MSGQTELMWGEEVIALEAATDWTEYKLGDLAEITSSKRIFYSDYVPSGVPFFRSKEIIDRYNRRAGGSELFIGEERFLEIKNKFGVPETGDILLTSVGTLGIPYLVEQKDRFYFKDGNLTWFRKINTKIINADYLLAWITSDIGKQKLDEIAIGSTQAALTIVGLKGLTIDLPTIAEQHAIAGVLRSLNDKINLFHRQNATLEALAETLFRQWFVEESKEEWNEGVLGDLFTLQRGFDLPTQNRVPGEFPIITSSGYSAGHNEYKIKGPGVTTGRSGVIGKVFFVMEDFWPLNTSLFIKEYKLGTPLFCYFTLKFVDLESFNAGSAVPTLNRNHVHAHVAAIPPKELIEAFEETAYPHFVKIYQNTKQIQTLTNLRDTLLPKLMSGEVRVAY